MKVVKNNNGITIVETLVAGIIAVIIALMTGALILALNKNIKIAQNRMSAVDLAAAQIEDLKVIANEDFNDARLAAGTDIASTLAVIPTGFTLTYNITDGDWTDDGAGDVDYKDVVVASGYSGISGTTPTMQLKSYLIE